MDLSEYRLRHPSEIDIYKNQMGNQKFYDYAISIYKHLAAMVSDARFDITKKVDIKNRAVFIKIACLYMIDFPGQLQINETFTEILKI